MTQPVVLQLLPYLKNSQSAALAAVHAASFQTGWSADAIAGFVQSEGVACFFAAEDGAVAQPLLGFILVRAVAGEAEVLTVAVLPRARRRGVGRALLTAAVGFARSRMADAIYLEVAKENRAAISLYEGAGFLIAGQRPAYYEGPRGPEDAWIMRLLLNPAPEPSDGR